MKIVHDNGSVWERKMIDGNDATVVQSEDGYTIWSNEPGGAIIGHENLEEAIADFIRAMELSNALKKFLHWKKTGNWLTN